MRRVLTAGAALAALLVTACHDQRISIAELQARQAALKAQPAVAVDPNQLGLTDVRPYLIRTGDILTVRLIGLLTDRYALTSIEARVHSNGTISLPVVGEIAVAEKTLMQAEETIIAAHKDVVKDLSVFVEVTDAQSTTVTVTGAAKSPGMIKLRSNERNVYYAVALAGGFGPAGTGRILVHPVRPERDAAIYDFNQINDVRRALLSLPLDAGDVVEVEAAPTPVVYVNGLVLQPGATPIAAGGQTTVLRAIAAAGGIKPYLIIEDGELVRALPNGEQVVVKLKLGDMLAGREADVPLMAGDILRVPQTILTMAQEWAVQNILAGPFQISMRYDPLQQYNTERAFGNNNSSLSDSIKNSLTTGLPQLIVPTPTAVR